MFLQLLLAAQPVSAWVDQTAYVNLAAEIGQPEHIASGFIYGIPDNDQVPDHWYTDIDFLGSRAGGAQLGAPNRGWLYGLDEYYGRLNSTLDNYFTCRNVNADFILLPHDVWGTDHANQSTKWPGDDGDWSDYDAFVNQLMSDLVARDATDGMNWDIWNEPDISVFWNRSTQQWVDLYIRTTQLIRNNSAMDDVLLSGPSLAFRPMPNNTWWSAWLPQVAGNNSAPDQYSYHLEGDTDAVDNDPQYTNGSLISLLNQYNLPARQVNINEYANLGEQTPSGYAWWISRLERYGFIGLLGNWQGGLVLHDLFANLLTKTNNPKNYTETDYVPAAGYPMYKYYAQNMTGTKVNTTGSNDRTFDAYATLGDDKVRVLAGTRTYLGDYQLTIENLQQAGYSDSQQVSVEIFAFYGCNNIFDVSGPARSLGMKSYQSSGGSIDIQFTQYDNHTGWAFELPIQKQS